MELGGRDEDKMPVPWTGPELAQALAVWMNRANPAASTSVSCEENLSMHLPSGWGWGKLAPGPSGLGEKGQRADISFYCLL